LDPDLEISLPGIVAPSKIRLFPSKNHKFANFLVGGKSAALLLAGDNVLDGQNLPAYKIVALPVADAHQIRAADPHKAGSPQILVGTRFGGFHTAGPGKNALWQLTPLQPEVRGPYADLQLLDLNGDGHTDLITSYGKVYLRQADGTLPATPTLQ